MTTFATPEATQRKNQSKDLPFVPRVLGRTDLHVSPYGFGAYRIDDRTRTHHKSLNHALVKGCNLIDTSSNYADGHSELLVGKVIQEHIAAGTIKRDEVVIVTKAGYLQGSNLKLAQDKKKQGIPFTEVVELGDDLWHCISPDFLADQIQRSMERLNVEKLDVFLLHNPEYFLKKTPDTTVYYERLERAFSFLEEQVKSGFISHYGVSSNTFPESHTSKEFTSLEKLMAIAQSVSATHHFSVIQCPLNIFESGAVLERNNSGKTVLEIAKQFNLGVLINRPLNAFVNQQLFRLASFSAPKTSESALEDSLKSALENSMQIEKEYPVTSEDMPFMVGHVLKQHLDKIEDMTVWKELFSYQINPLLERSFKLLATFPDLETWSKQYTANAFKLIEVFTQWMEFRSSQKSQWIVDGLAPYFNDVPEGTSLSQMVLSLYNELPISSTLVGMREMKYVEDVFLTPKLRLKSSVDEILMRIHEVIRQK